MNLEAKKDHIIRCVKLGMDLYKACIVSECTEDEISGIENDKAFEKRIEAIQARAEYELLEQHATACSEAAERGNASAIQWKLGKINPKWENKDRDLTLKTPSSVTVVLKGRAPSGPAKD